MDKKQFDAKYFPYILNEYVPIVVNMKDTKQIISSRYKVIRLPEEYWEMFPIKLPDY